MRPYSLLFLGVLMCASRPAADTGDVAAKIRVLPLASTKHLHEPCSFSGRLHACTVFETTRLIADCRKRDDHWHLDVRMEVEAVIYLPETRWLRHEWDHIDDVLAALGQHQRRLENRPYESRHDCERAAVAETAGFARQVSIFVEASNDRLR